MTNVRDLGTSQYVAWYKTYTTIVYFQHNNDTTSWHNRRHKDWCPAYFESRKEAIKFLKSRSITAKGLTVSCLRPKQTLNSFHDNLVTNTYWEERCDDMPPLKRAYNRRQQ